MERASEDENMQPSYRAIYHSLVHINNKLGWKVKFGAQYREVMHFASLTSKTTYYRAIKYLHANHYINLFPGKNEYSTAYFELNAEYQKMGTQRESGGNQLGTLEGISLVKQEESKGNRDINKPNKLIKPLNLLNFKTSESDKSSLISEKEFNKNQEQIKEKNSSKKENPPEKIEETIWPSFEEFWNEYDKKYDRNACERKWNKLKQPDKEQIMHHIPKYKESQPDKKFRKNPETYLNNQSWNNEIITSAQSTSSINQTKFSTRSGDKESSRGQLKNLAVQILQGGSKHDSGSN